MNVNIICKPNAEVAFSSLELGDGFYTNNRLAIKTDTTACLLYNESTKIWTTATMTTTANVIPVNLMLTTTM